MTESNFIKKPLLKLKKLSLYPNLFKEKFSNVTGKLSIEFCHKYTKLAMLSFLYWFVVKGKSISAKSLPPVEIEPATLRH